MSKSTREQADKEERKLAKKLGGRQTSNSGAGPWDKGDVVAQGCRIDHKYTDAKQYTFRAADLRKLIGECKSWEEIALLWIKFRTLNEEYVIMSSDDFTRILDQRSSEK
jgi:hypothetical protein